MEHIHGKALYTYTARDSRTGYYQFTARLSLCGLIALRSLDMTPYLFLWTLSSSLRQAKHGSGIKAIKHVETLLSHRPSQYLAQQESY